MFLKLEGHTVNHQAQGLVITSLGLVMTLGNGTTVQFNAPFLPIGDGLGVAPVVELDGDMALRIDMSRWQPVYVTPALTASLPFVTPEQGLAVRVTREFHADRAISWASPAEDMVAWLQAWFAANGVAAKHAGSAGGAA